MPTNLSQIKPKASLDMLLAASLLFSLTGCSLADGSINDAAEDANSTQVEAPVTGDTLTNEISTNGAVINGSATNATEKNSSEKNKTAANSTVASRTPVGLGLDNTYWKLTILGDNAVVTGDDQQELYMMLNSDEAKVTGFSGCNRFAGSYALQQAQISFEQLLLTRKNCFQNMGLEHQFLAVLAETEYYALNDAALILYNNDGSVLAQFASRYLQ